MPEVGYRVTVTGNLDVKAGRSLLRIRNRSTLGGATVLKTLS
jgi:hypothetical protein